MAVSKDNTRTLITIPKQLKAQAEKKAASENRSFSNYVLSLIVADIEKDKKTNK